jgi:hypothetical protein
LFVLEPDFPILFENIITTGGRKKCYQQKPKNAISALHVAAKLES